MTVENEGYSKIEMAMLDRFQADVIEDLKNKVSENLKNIVGRVYIKYNKDRKEMTVTLPDYNTEKYTDYINGVVSSFVAIGFDVYVKEGVC